MNGDLAIPRSSNALTSYISSSSNLPRWRIIPSYSRLQYNYSPSEHSRAFTTKPHHTQLRIALALISSTPSSICFLLLRQFRSFLCTQLSSTLTTFINTATSAFELS